ncbi:MAG: 8-amino-7-oxononanoate synthase [Osedax symbiont Rs2]|nr:MAG: 8-amino-7-oxononanoate synthase [Osedax symbiont Rs2]
MSFDNLQKMLDQRKQRSLYRRREILQSPQGPKIIVAGKTLLNFSSNDYLGLANHPRVVESFKLAADEFGVGGGASHLVNGHSHHHHQLELELAEFCNRSRALLFCSGYMANIGVINALLGKNDAVFQDKLNHASLLDGGLLSAAKFQRYLHNDMGSLEQKLARSTAERKLIVTDAVFSMDGNIANLPALADKALQYNAWLMIDDAHGIGALGETGAGCSELYQLSEQQVPVLMGTLGKAFGTSGAFVAGSDALIETLIQFSRTYIYTTSMPPAVAAATRTSLKLIQKESWRREHLQLLISRFKSGCEQLGLVLLPSDTAIQPIMIGAEHTAVAFSEKLSSLGVQVKAIRTPTVPLNQARLRVTFSASHSLEDLQQLLAALATVLKEIKIEYPY